MEQKHRVRCTLQPFQYISPSLALLQEYLVQATHCYIHSVFLQTVVSSIYNASIFALTNILKQN